jgi:hypothetical protein
MIGFVEQLSMIILYYLISFQREFDDNTDENASHSMAMQQDGALPQNSSHVSQASQTKEYPRKCYYCTIGGFNNKNHYETHVIRCHKGKTAYPSHTDIEVLDSYS